MKTRKVHAVRTLAIGGLVGRSFCGRVGLPVSLVREDITCKRCVKGFEEERQQRFVIDAFSRAVYGSPQMDIQHTPLFETISYTPQQIIDVPPTLAGGNA